MASVRVWLALSLAGCASAAAEHPPTVTYALSSPDVGVAWHLHAKDGALLCALPCDRALPADSGAWLGDHDPKKSWRLDVPSELPAPAGSRVFATAHVGKGNPALGTLGYMTAIPGATAAVAGVALLVASFISFTQGCSATDTSCTHFDDAATFATIGAPLVGIGAVLSVVGVYLTDHNHAPTLHLVPTGVAGTF